MNQPTSSAAVKGVIYPILFGFFVMGFADIVGTATNYVKDDFKLSDTMANLLPMMVFIWFALFSIPTGLVMGRIGKRNTVVIGLGLTAVAMVLPLVVYNFAWILVAFTLLGIGNTVLQVTLNPMVAGVVRPERMASVVTLGQFVKAISSFLGPILAGWAASWFGDWKLIFAAYAATSVISTVWLLAAVPVREPGEPEDRATFKSTLALFRDPYIVMLFGIVLFVVGIDVGLNTSIPKLLQERSTMTLQEAAMGTSAYFLARIGGSFFGALILARYAADRFLKYSIFIAIAAFIALLAVHHVPTLFVLIVIVGLACTNIFSIAFAYALKHKPDRSNEISSLMIMGVSGGALVTLLMGVVADRWGQTVSMSVLLVCMGYIAFAAFRIKK